MPCLSLFRIKVVIGGDTRNHSNENEDEEEERAIKYMHIEDSMSDNAK